MSFSMRDQLDRDVVDARVIRQHTGRELGQLLVVAAWQMGSHLSDEFLDDIRIVQKPFARRADVYTTLRCVGKTIVNPVEQGSRVIEPLEERSVSALFFRRKKLVRPGDVAGMLREPVGAEDLSANRSYELSVRCIRGAAKELKESVGFSSGRSCCCHEASECQRHAGKLPASPLFRPGDDEGARCVCVQLSARVGQPALGCRGSLAHVNYLT